MIMSGDFLQDCVYRIPILQAEAIYMSILTISHQIKPLAFVFDPKQSGGSLKKLSYIKYVPRNLAC